MMHTETRKLLSIYLIGFVLVFGQVLAASILVMWGLQVIAMTFGESYDWDAILRHLVLSLAFLVYFPGQNVWTFRVRGPDKRIYTIVGRADTETDDNR